MGRLIDADKLILNLNDWGLAISPDERTPDIVKEYTAKDMSKMEYRTIQTAMLVIKETPTVEAIPRKQIDEMIAEIEDNFYDTNYFQSVRATKDEILEVIHKYCDKPNDGTRPYYTNEWNAPYKGVNNGNVN